MFAASTPVSADSLPSGWHLSATIANVPKAMSAAAGLGFWALRDLHTLAVVARGQLRWVRALDSSANIFTTPVVVAEAVVVIAEGFGSKRPPRVAAFAADTGAEQWSQCPALRLSTFGLVAGGGLVFVHGSEKGGESIAVAYAAATGERRWTQRLPFGNGLCWANGRLYAPTFRGLYRLDGPAEPVCVSPLPASALFARDEQLYLFLRGLLGSGEFPQAGVAWLAEPTGQERGRFGGDALTNAAGLLVPLQAAGRVLVTGNLAGEGEIVDVAANNVWTTVQLPDGQGIGGAAVTPSGLVVLGTKADFTQLVWLLDADTGRPAGQLPVPPDLCNAQVYASGNELLISSSNQLLLFHYHPA